MKSDNSRRPSSGGNKRNTSNSKPAATRKKSDGDGVWRIGSSDSDGDSRPRSRTAGKSQSNNSGRKSDGKKEITPKKRISVKDEGAKRTTRRYNDEEKPTTRSRTAGKSQSNSSGRKYEDRNEATPKKRITLKDEGAKRTTRRYNDDEKPNTRSRSTRDAKSESSSYKSKEKRSVDRVSARTERYDDTSAPKKVIVRGRKSSSKSDGVRLNKFIANSGICSRREADEFIEAGVVTVNGEVVTTLGAKVKSTDDIRFNGQRLQGEKKVYILLNKPKDFVTTVEDPHADKTVMDLVAGACSERVYPVGRLDRNTTGVLLITNDGELTKQLTHPSSEKVKIYHVFLDKDVTRNDLARLAEGFALEDGFIQADSVDYVDDKKTEVGVEIHSGRNHIVRRMFEHLGYKVMKLDRVYFAGLTKKGLKRGGWRMLTPKEINMLKMGAFD